MYAIRSYYVYGEVGGMAHLGKAGRLSQLGQGRRIQAVVAGKVGVLAVKGAVLRVEIRHEQLTAGGQQGVGIGEEAGQIPHRNNFV